MTTIKSPQTISRNKSNNKGYVTILLLITWVVIALGYYGIKTGMLQSDASNPTLDAKIAEIESKTTVLEGRIAKLEKKLSDVGAALTPGSSAPDAAAPADSMKPADAMKPMDTMKPAEAPVDAMKPAETHKPEEVKKPEAGATAPLDPSAAEPKLDEKKAEPATKPQTNNQSGKDNRASVEKKSSSLIASVVAYQ